MILKTLLNWLFAATLLLCLALNLAALRAQVSDDDDSPTKENPPASEGEKHKTPLPKQTENIIHAKSEPEKNSGPQIEVRGYFALGLNLGSELEKYSDGLADYSALINGQNTGKTYSVEKTSSMGSFFSAGGEFMLEHSQTRWLLSLRYADFRDASYGLKAGKNTDTLSVAPKAYSGHLLVLFPLFSLLDMQIWAGGGFGVCIESITLSYQGASGAFSSAYWGWSFGVAGRIEATTTIFGLPVFFGVQGDYAPIQKFEMNGVSLINGNNGKVVPAGLTGFSAFAGIGYRF
jgi:hypothetical protein